ncbi:MAG: NAD(+) diphosphatase [Nitrospiraceae bacterium]|nr:NAD(+) diphosphatase [Nitrospiraceae bacterium]
MNFVPAFLPSSSHAEPALWFVFCGDNMLVTEDAPGIPRGDEIGGLTDSLLRSHHLGTLDDSPCYAAEVPAGTGAPAGMSFHGLRTLLGTLGEDLFTVAGRAFQVIDWDRTHQFCGRCGKNTEPKKDERARVCPSCDLVSYPDVTPAVIMAVTRGNELLLARSGRFTGSFFSVLAGFVEQGETFEECVKREVREEVGIEIDNLRYFGSQPWPFPHSLMVGFTAEYAGGEISIDHEEISEAGWFTAATLPEIPRRGTIARRLIDWFSSGCEAIQGED